MIGFKDCNKLTNTLDLSKNSLVVINQNIRSVRSNFEAFLIELNELNFVADIIVLTEIWITNLESNHYKIPGYTLYCHCNDRYRSGGVAVYILDEVCRVTEISVLSEIQSADCLLLSLIVDGHSISLLAVYRLHSTPFHQFILDIDNFLVARTSNKNFILLGDFNIDILANNTIVHDYISCLSSYGFSSLVNEPTRIVNNSISCLDHVFVRYSKSFEISSEAKVFHNDITDHSTVILFVNFKDFNGIVSKLCELKNKINYNKLANFMNSIDWTCVYSESNVSTAFDIFLNILNLGIDGCSESYILNSKSNKINPWMNDYLLKRVRRRKKLFQLRMRHPNNLHLFSYYNAFKKKLKGDISEAKEYYYLNKFKEYSGNSRAQWKTVNRLIGEDKPNKIISEIKVDDKIITQQKDIAMEFNRFFSNIANTLRTKIKMPQFNEHCDSKFQKYIEQRSIFLFPTHKSEILNIIYSLKNSSSSDKINSLTVKKMAPYIVDILVYLFNYSFETGVFPDCLKVAVVVPILKRGDSKNMSNYRPISLLSIFSKILEKVMKKRLIEFFELNSFFSNSQFGFRSGLSTEDALVTFLSNIHDSINKGEQCAALYVDITKAFDTVDHNILLNKLWNAGVRGVAYRWFVSYLSLRKQRVKIGESVSTDEFIDHGVPQGSVLGPILFLIYINDLCNSKLSGQITAFADDIALFFHSQTLVSIQQSIEHDLLLLRYWFDTNFMVLSEKTKYQIFNTKKNLTFPDLLFFHSMSCNGRDMCNCIEILQTENIKYLGLVINCRISWKEHISKIKNDMYKCLRKFYFLREICPEKVLCTLYHALVGSRLSYGLSCWGGTYISTLFPLVILQKNFIRLIAKKTKTTHAWPFFQKYKILPLRHLYVFKVLRLFYNRSSNDFESLYKQYNLRRNLIVPVPQSKLKLHQQFYSCSAPRLFNHISSKITKRQTQRQFLFGLKQFLFNTENIEDYFNFTV